MKYSSRNVLFILFSLSFLILMMKPIRSLIAFAADRSNENASQILVIPFLSAGLIWINRKNIFRDIRPSVLPGAAVMVLGFVLFVVGRTAGARLGENDYLALMAASCIVVWLGGFILTYGYSTFRAGLFPLLLLLFAIPVPSALLHRIIGILQRGSADIAYALLKLTGMPVYRSNFLIAMPDLVIEVAPECSGIRSGIAIVIAGLVAGHLFLRSGWKKTALLLAAIPVLLFKNGLRIAVLAFLAARVDVRIITSELHREGGIPFFVVGLCLMYPVLVMLMKSEKQSSS